MHGFHLQMETFHLVRPQEEVLIPLAPQSLPSDIFFGFLEPWCLYLSDLLPLVNVKLLCCTTNLLWCMLCIMVMVCKFIVAWVLNSSSVSDQQLNFHAVQSICCLLISIFQILDLIHL